MGLCLVGHHPVRSKGGDSRRPGQNATSTFMCPRSPGLTPRSPDGYLLMNSLVNRISLQKVAEPGDDPLVGILNDVMARVVQLFYNRAGKALLP